jgi:protein AbiQ
MDFFHVKDSYIEFLRQYDTRVAENKHESRPYVGIVVQIGEVKYYAPFTSPKRKHLRMKNAKDFRKIAQGQYGAINFNNMIPVPDSALIVQSIKAEPDLKYRRLLQNQYVAIREDWASIEKTARRLRELVISDEAELSAYDRKLKFRCCDFSKLEAVLGQYTDK